jgi:hypothetical protein
LLQVFTAVLHLIIIYRYAMNYSQMGHLSRANTGSMAHSVVASFTLINKFCVFYTIWTRKQGYCELLNEVKKYKPKSGRIHYLMPVMPLLTCCFYLALSVICTVAGHGIFYIQEWTPSTFVSKSIESSRDFFWMPAAERGSSDTEIDYLLCAVQVVLQLYKHLVAFYAEAHVLAGALIFRHLAYRFKDSFVDISPSRLLVDYTTLKRTTGRINSVFGLALLGSLMDETVYSAIYIGELVAVTDWLQLLRYTFFLFAIFLTLFVAADAAHQVKTLKDWISESNDQNLHGLSTRRLVLLVDELNCHRVGMSPLGLFTVTYGLIGTVSGQLEDHLKALGVEV